MALGIGVYMLFTQTSPSVELQRGQASEDGDSIITQPGYQGFSADDDIVDTCEDKCGLILDYCRTNYPGDKNECFYYWPECLDNCDAEQL